MYPERLPIHTPQNDLEHLARLQDYYARHRAIPAYERLCTLWGTIRWSIHQP